MSVYQNWINKWTNREGKSTDAENEKVNITITVSISVIVGAAAIFWGLSYWFIGLKSSAVYPLAYAAISYLVLGYYIYSKNFKILKFIQLFALLLTPFLLQFSLGGFTDGSAVMIWAFLAPVGVLVLSGKRESLKWLIIYLAILTASSFLEANQLLPKIEISNNIRIAYFVFNIATVSIVSYLILAYFIGESEKQKNRSEELLLNVLPKKIAEKLKFDQGVIAETYPAASVLFADLVGFTRLTEKMSPAEMIELLNTVFSYFDSLTKKYDLEKIRTIGDNYMVASGVPTPRPDHAQALANMALEIVDYTKNISLKRGEAINFRVGFNSGSMTGGVIGQTKFHFDVWGDVVNTASRMESQGLPGKIQVTSNTYKLLKNEYNFKNRGNINVKGKGEMETYFLISKK